MRASGRAYRVLGALLDQQEHGDALSLDNDLAPPPITDPRAIDHPAGTRVIQPSAEDLPRPKASASRSIDADLTGNAFMRRPRAEARLPVGIRHWVFLLVLASLTYVFVFSDQGVKALLRTRHQTEDVRARSARLEDLEEQLEMKRSALISGEGIEDEARSRGFIRPGDEVYRLPGGQGSEVERLPPPAVERGN